MKTTAEKIAVMQAYEDGKKIQVDFDFGTSTTFVVKTINGELEWDWKYTLYSIVEEQQRVPFDYTDIQNLLWKKFKHKNDRYEEVFCVGANEVGVILPCKKVIYNELSEHWLKWNDLLKVWEECSKVK